MTTREQAMWLAMFNAALSGGTSADWSVKAADKGLEEFRARMPQRRSLWERLFGRRRKPDAVAYMRFEWAPPPEPATEEPRTPERWFRAITKGGLTVGYGTLASARSGALQSRSMGCAVAIQATTDLGKTWVDVSDDGEPLPPKVDEHQGDLFPKPVAPADPALSPPPPPADSEAEPHA